MKCLDDQTCNVEYPLNMTKNGKVFATLRTWEGVTVEGKTSPYCDMMGGYNGSGLLGPCFQVNPGETISIKVRNEYGNGMETLKQHKAYRSDWVGAMQDKVYDVSNNPLFMGEPTAHAYPAGLLDNYNASQLVQETDPDTGKPLAADEADNNPGWVVDFDTTNLHLHGLKTAGLIFYPVGTTLMDAPWVSIEPTDANGKKCFCYQVPISKSQATGTYLMHVHRHGAASMQTWSGSFGAVQVGDQDLVGSLANTLRDKYDVTRDEAHVLWAPQLRFKGTAYNMSAYDDGSVPAPGSEEEAKLVNEGIAELEETNLNQAINGAIGPPMDTNEYQPTWEFATGEVARIRFIVATVTRMIPIQIEDSQGNVIPMQNVASDGISYTKPYARNRFLLASGQREDIIVCFDEPGNYKVVGRYGLMLDFAHLLRNFTLSFIKVTGPSKACPDISTWEFGDKYTETPIPASRVVGDTKEMILTFQTNIRTMPLPQVGINSKQFFVTQPGIVSTCGTAEEWNFFSNHADTHPMHVHINPYQIVNITFATDEQLKPIYDAADSASTFEEWKSALDTFQPENVEALITNQLSPPGKWRDTTLVPAYHNLRIRIAMDATYPDTGKCIQGKSVEHCHLLDHEDFGMMTAINIAAAPTEEANAVKAQAIEQGVAISPLGNGVDNLRVAATATFRHQEMEIITVCPSYESFCLRAGTFTMGQQTDSSTLDTVVNPGPFPSVSWPCDKEHLYTMVFFGSAPGETTGTLNWAKVNVECGDDLVAHGDKTGNTWGIDASKSPQGYRGVVGEYRSPRNPNFNKLNYGFYIFAQGFSEPFTASDDDVISIGNAATNGNVSLPDFLATFGTTILDGPVARTWAWLHGSAFSTHGANLAAVSDLCGVLPPRAFEKCLIIEYRWPLGVGLAAALIVFAAVVLLGYRRAPPRSLSANRSSSVSAVADVELAPTKQIESL